LDGKPEMNRPLGCHRHRWGINIKIDLLKKSEVVDSIQMTHVGIKLYINIPALPSTTTSALKTEAVRFSKPCASTDKSTRCQNPEQFHHPHHCKKHKSHFYACLHPCEVPIQITLDCPSIGTKQLEWLNEHS
jgi:hypothetical protein